MPSGMAITAAMTIAATVRSHGLDEIEAEPPPAMPFHSAWNVSTGEGSSTGSTICFQTAKYQSAIRPTTPRTGRNGSTPLHPLRTSRWNTSRQCALMRTKSFPTAFRRRAAARASKAHEVGDPRRTARKQKHAVGQIHRLFQVVRDQHRRGLGLHEDALQLLAHEQRHLVVERRERLVEEQDLRLDHQRPHDRDKLLLPAGHLVGIAIEIDLDAKMRHQLLDPRARSAFGTFISFSGYSILSKERSQGNSASR